MLVPQAPVITRSRSRVPPKTPIALPAPPPAPRPRSASPGRDSECCICLQPYSGRPALLACGHRYDAACLHAWLAEDAAHSCPACRARAV
jgi:hypothetical protein